MSADRCDLCGLWCCEHKGKETVISLGTTLGEPITERIRVSLNQPSDTIPGPAPDTQQRIIIPPPPRVPSDLSAAPKTAQDLWITCSLCRSKVHINYLMSHQKCHIQSSKPMPTSSAIVRYPNYTPPVHQTTPPPQQSAIEKIKLCPIESYKFRTIDTACAASSMSQDYRYSDITVILWLKEKTGVSSGHYMGANVSTTYKDYHRVSIHVVYDSLEDYYILATKLLKRSSYSSYDNEENIPDRICLTAKELNDEIKRALLFFCISPRGAYKQFRKLFKQELTIDYDAANRACIAQTENCTTLFERLKKVESYQSSHQSYAGYCGYD